MTTMTMPQLNEKQAAKKSHSEQETRNNTILYHCEECNAWWGKDVYPSNPLARYALFLTHSFNWENYHGWHTEQGVDHICTVCGFPNPQMFTT